MNAENRKKIEDAKKLRKRYSAEMLAATHFAVWHEGGCLMVDPLYSGYAQPHRGKLVRTDKGGYIPVSQGYFKDGWYRKQHN